jgi:hypothetical protein
MAKMEQNNKDVISAIQRNIRELILKFQDQQEERMGDLSKLNTKTLIAMEQSLRFWCADAIIRLIQLPEDISLNPWLLYEKAEKIAAELTLEELEECYLQTKDERTLTALIIFRLDVVAVQKEAERRFDVQKAGKAFAYFLDHPSDRTALNLLLNILGKQISRLLLKTRWGVSPETLKLLEALKAKEYDSQEERKKGRLEYKHESVLKIYNFYDELKKAIELDDIESIPASLITGFRRANNPIWEQQAPIILKELIGEMIETQLPILSGEMEAVPLKIYDNQRTKDRRERRFLQLSYLNIEESKDEAGYKKGESEEDKLYFKAMQIEGKDERSAENELTEAILQSELKKRIGINRNSTNEEILKCIENNLEGQAKIKRKVLKAFELILLRNMSEQEALSRVKLSDRTMRDYKIKLRVKLTSYLS